MKNKVNEPKTKGDFALPELECLRCGYKWIPRTGKPKSCPKCRSPKWDEEPKVEIGGK